jgi:hypothetical protein
MHIFRVSLNASEASASDAYSSVLRYVIEITCLDTDVLVEDNQISAISANSHVLLTTRKQLIAGQDFRIVRTLTEAGLEDSDDDEYGENHDSPF